MAAQCLTELDFEEKLIQLIQEKPFLYQKSRTDYKDAPKKLNAWESIALAMNSNVDHCKSTWDNIRKQYTAYLKKLDNPTGSGRGAEPFFRHSRAMEFYKGVYRPHKNKTFTNFQMPNDVEYSENVDEIDESSSQVVLNFEDVREMIEINATKSSTQATQSGQYTVNVQPRREKTKRKSNEEFEKKFLDLYEKSATKEDEFFYFGQVVADKLRKMSSKGTDTMEIQIKVLQLLNRQSVEQISRDSNSPD